MTLTDVLFVLFCALAVVGIALIYLPAALILGGLAGAAATWFADRGRKVREIR